MAHWQKSRGWQERKDRLLAAHNRRAGLCPTQCRRGMRAGAIARDHARRFVPCLSQRGVIGRENRAWAQPPASAERMKILSPELTLALGARTKSKPLMLQV